MSDDEAPDFQTGRLHPEGAPGIFDAALRQIMGDSQYEAMQQHNGDMQQLQSEFTKAMTGLTLDRYRTITALLSAVTAGLIILVVLGTIAGITALVQWWL